MNFRLSTLSRLMVQNRRPCEPSCSDVLGYFLAWNTYGTWLPGDARGWVKYQQGFQLPNPMVELEAAAIMAEDSCVLNVDQRDVVNETITRHCEIRGWQLHAVNCRSNHVHSVISAARDPDEIREQLKAWCTRKLKERASACGQTAHRQNWWAERGSCRWLNDEVSLEAAILYVRDAQDRKGIPH